MRLEPSFFRLPFTVTKPPASRVAEVIWSSSPLEPFNSAIGSSDSPS